MDFTGLYQFVKGCFRFKGFAFEGLHDLPDQVLVVLKRTGKTGTCPKCGRQRQKIEELHTRKIRDLDIRKKCIVMFPQGKIRCTCGYRGVEHVDFVDKYSLYTKGFEEFVFMLSEKMTLKNTASVCRINWKTAKNIDKKYLAKEVASLSLFSPEKIGIDEIAYEKGHKYLTVVRDVDAGRVIWVGEGRKKETLDQFFSELGKEKSSRIKIVVMDMWDPYIASVKENCPDADIVFDKFHVSKKVNEALDSVRKKEFSKADEKERKDMKRKRFLILSRQKRLDDGQRETIDDLKRINARLYEAYLLKEQILDIFDEKNVHGALVRLGKWIANVERLRITAYLAVANTIKNYWYGIANYFKYQLTNAASEGFNNKINVIRRMAYGYKDLDFFKLKILHNCGWKSS